MPRYEVAMGGGNPDYKLVLYTSVSGTTVGASLYWRRSGSSSYTSYNGAASFNITIQGASVASGSYNFNAPAGGAIGETFIASGSRNVGGIGSASVAGFFNTDTSAAGYGEVWGAQSVATAPAAPVPVAGTPDQASATSLRYQFNGGGDGGSAIVRSEFQYSTSSTFASGNSGLIVSNGTTVVNDLTPSTTYYFRSRQVNGVGTGPWSATRSGATLAAGAPSLVVTAAPAGTSAVASSTPSSSMPNPTGWRLERRLQGTTSPVTVTDLPTMPVTVTGLAQGAVYEWRLAALQGSYVSPYTSWQATQQPNPNTTPGNYFDGSTAASGDAVYSWAGAAGNSTSRATGKTVAGWVVAAGASGAAATLSQQLGGRSQSRSARITFTGGATAAGFSLQNSSAATMAAIAEGGEYSGSVHVQLPGRSQRLRLRILWYTEASAYVGETAGAVELLASAPGAWRRLVTSGVAPAGATRGRLVLDDVTGTGWAAWSAGDVMLVDDAMISLGSYPYFDGNTADTPAFDYEWLGAPNASASIRNLRTLEDEDPLADPDCIAPPAPPRPPSVLDECIEETGSWRRYWAIIPEERVAKWIASVPTVKLSTGGLAARQARIRIYRNPDNLTPDLFDDVDEWESEQIVSYIPPNATFTLDGVSERARASVGQHEGLPADHMLFGTGGTPATWPTLRCGTSYLMSVDVPLDSPAGNLSVGVSLTKRM